MQHLPRADLDTRLAVGAIARWRIVRAQGTLGARGGSHHVGLISCRAGVARSGWLHGSAVVAVEVVRAVDAGCAASIRGVRSWRAFFTHPSREKDRESEYCREDQRWQNIKCQYLDEV